MTEVTKIVKVYGVCLFCGQKNDGKVTVKGKRGTMKDFSSTEKCRRCNKNVTLTKIGLRF